MIEVGGVWREKIINHIMPDDDFWAKMFCGCSGSKTLDQAELMLQSFVRKLGRRLDKM